MTTYAEREARCHRLDRHYDNLDSAVIEEGDPIVWSFVGGGWAHERCADDEVEPEEFVTTPRWKSGAPYATNRGW